MRKKKNSSGGSQAAQAAENGFYGERKCISEDTLMSNRRRCTGITFMM